MPAQPTVLVQSLVTQCRTESDLNASQVFTDNDIATLLSDAGSDLRDLFTQTNQLYDVSTFNFTLSGGLGDTNGVNSWDLSGTPGDFQQGHSVDINPGTATPFTLKYLSNWLDRNKASSPIPFTAPAGGPRCYCFLGTKLMVFPPMNAAGNYRLYYTPMWKPFALPATVLAETASISIPIVSGNTGITAGLTFKANAGSPANVFLPTDAGNTLVITGAVNSGNNGSHTIATVISANEVSFTSTSGLVSESFPLTATVTLLRESNVTTGGTWTLFGNNPFNNTSIDVNVGDTLIVSGAVNAGNNGSFTITAAEIGGTTITTAGATGLVAENFNSANLSVTVQPGGTIATLPTIMNPWILYLKTIAIITIRNKRGQDVDAFERRLAVQKDRIQTILQERQMEGTQPPLTRGQGDFFSGDFGGW